MDRGKIQVIGALLLAFVGAAAAVVIGTESDVRLVLASPQPERAHATEAPSLTLPVESLIDEAIEGNSSDAASQLVVAGRTDPAIVALLLERFKKVSGRPAAIVILARIGNSVVPQAISLLEDERDEVRWSVLRLLLCLDDLPPSVTPRIARCLRDEDVWVRRWAAMLLARIDNEACRSDLLAACRDNDAEVRWRSLRALHQGRPSSAFPEQLLQNARTDPDPDVRYVASHLSESAVVDRQP